jgi:hypothetical protein
MLFIQIVINMLIYEKDYFMVTKYEIILEIKVFLKFDYSTLLISYIYIH